MAKTITIPDNRTGFSMKIDGIQLTRPDLYHIAAELGIATKDILFSNGVLTVYNTSNVCQEIIDDNALGAFVAMAIDISSESISQMTAVKAKPKILEMDDIEEDEEED